MRHYTSRMMPQTPSYPQRPRKFRTARTVSALVLREMSTTYGRTSLGYLWALMEPVAGIMLLTLVFSITFHAPPLGTNFALFYASGLMPFMMYMDLSGKIATSLRFSQPLLFYPGVTFVDAILARVVLNIFTELMVFTLVMSGIIIGMDVDVILDVPAILYGIAMAFALAIGVGTMNCFLLTMFPVWERAWAILNRPLLIVSCVLFTLDSVPQPFQDFLWWNPLVQIVGQVRSGIYPTYDANYVSALYVFGVSGVLLAAGLLLLDRYKSYLINDG